MNKETNKKIQERINKLDYIEKCKQLKIGDTVQSIFSDTPEIIESIIHNDKGDFRNEGDGERITINDLHWYVSDIIIIKIMHNMKTIEDVLEMVQGKELTEYINSQIDAICVKEGYFIHKMSPCKDYWKGKQTIISNWIDKKHGFLVIYRCKTKDILIKAYDRHIIEDLNEDDKAPKDMIYKKIVKPVFFEYLKDGKKSKGWIINSNEFLKK